VTKKIKILAVDDQDINLHLLKHILKDGEFDVLVTDDEEGVMNMFKMHPDVDIILLDRMIYETDGIETVKRLKEMPLYKHIPIIMITSTWSPKMAADALAAGAYAYLPKPYDKEKILKTIRATLEGSAGS
jgi:CheY-like chemotaxis protein